LNKTYVLIKINKDQPPQLWSLVTYFQVMKKREVQQFGDGGEWECSDTDRGNIGNENEGIDVGRQEHVSMEELPIQHIT